MDTGQGGELMVYRVWLRDTWPGWGLDGVQGVVKGYWIGWVIVGWRVWALWGVQLGNGEYE